MTTSKLHFRKDVLEALPHGAKRYQVQDEKVGALRLFVFPSGIKTFFLYRKINQKPERIKIGRFPNVTIEQARKKAVILNSQIELGSNPAAEERKFKQEFTFRTLFELYYNEHLLLHRKRPDDIKAVVEFHILPVIGNTFLPDITRDGIIKLFLRIAEKRGKSAANKALAYISATFNFGIPRHLFEGLNPCIGIKKFKLSSRDRFLSQEELKNFLKSVECEKPIFRDYFLLLLYTGARKANVLSMKWSDLRLEQKQWRIAETQSKNNEVNIVNLPEKALNILHRRFKENERSEKQSLFVFPGDGECGHLHDPKKAFKRIKKRMKVNDIRIHDLRRTLGSYMAISGSSLLTIGKALNHKSTASTEIYARLSQNAVLEAVNKAAKLIDGNVF